MPEPVTIAIPYYKGLDYLRRAIESALRQSSPDWRLIVVDDGASSPPPRPGEETGGRASFDAKAASTVAKPTPLPEAGKEEQLLASFNEPRIRYFKNERNLGMAGNWNRCLELAETDLVNLLHNDDELLPNYVAEVQAAAQSYPDAAGFFCGTQIIDANGEPAFSFVDFVKRFLKPPGSGPIVLQGREAIRSLMRGNFIMCPTVCYRKSRLPADRFAARWKMVLDLDFFTRMLLGGGTLIGLPAIAYAYRRHDDNATTAYTESLLRFEEESRLYDEIASIARQRAWPDVERTAARKRIIRLHLAFRIVQDLSRLRFRPAGDKARFLWQLRPAG